MMGTENHNFIHSSLAANENMAQQTHLEKKKREPYYLPCFFFDFRDLLFVTKNYNYEDNCNYNNSLSSC